MIALFPDDYFHIGCDETVVVDNCTLEGQLFNISHVCMYNLLIIGISNLENSLLNYISDMRTPVGWEEVLFTSKAVSNGYSKSLKLQF